MYAAWINPELSEAAQQLRRSELLYDVPPFEQRCVAFRHPLIQEVAYKSLLQNRRREFHSKVGQAIETLFKDRLDERASLLAYHSEQAGENLKAAQQNMRAAVWIGANDPSQALRSWKKVRELLSAQPSSQPIDYLRMMACGQIVNFGWREGISSEDAAVYFEEAKKLALALGDIRANALIHAAYGRILANGGSADEYVQKIREAKAIADEGNDPSVQITLKAVLCHALSIVRLHVREALQMNVEATDRATEIVKFDRQTLGFDIESGCCYAWSNVGDARSKGEKPGRSLIVSLQLEEWSGRSLSIMSCRAWRMWISPGLEGNAGLAQVHADRAFSLYIKSGNSYLRVYAQACRGLSHIVAGRLTSAIDDLSEALRFGRSRKAGLENEPRILADLANAYRLNGDTQNAFLTVEEAIRVATERNARVPECLARIVHSKLLMRSGNNDQKIAGVQELDRGQALMRETGAMIFEACIDSSKGELEDARTSKAG